MSQPGYPSQFPQQPRPGAPYGQQPGPGYMPPPGYAPPPPSGDNPIGLIAMICGLLSFVMGCPLSIAAIVLGFIGLKKEPKGMATAGLILGIVTLTLNIVAGCFILALYGTAIGVAAAGVGMIIPYAETQSTFQNTAKKIEAHKQTAGAYPTEAEGTTIVQGVNDGWGNPIVYRPDGTEYTLVSGGPDGVMDNDDDETFYASSYDPSFGAAPGDYSYIQNPTERAITEGYDAVENHWLESDSDDYPPDAQGQSLVANLRDEWGNPLTYRQTEGGEYFLVISPGPDGMLDTPDDLNQDTYWNE